MGMQPNAAAIAAARASHKKWGIPASISLAQWALESAWGKRKSGPHNYLRMEALPRQPATIVTTHEVYEGVCVRCSSRSAPSPPMKEAFDGHGKLLATAGVDAKARAKLPDPFSFGSALTGVYASAPAYGRSLAAVIRGSNLT